MLAVKTDSVPDVITDTIPQALSGVGDVVEIIPEAVTTTVSRTRRLFRGSRSLSRRWWAIAGVVGVISAVTAIWITRRSDDRVESAEADTAPTVGTAPRRVA